MELFAATAKHAAASDRRLGPPALWWRRQTRRAAPGRPGEYAGAGRARPCGKRAVTRAAIGHSAAKGARTDFGAGGVAAPAIGSADQLGDSRGADSTSGAGV